MRLMQKSTSFVMFLVLTASSLATTVVPRKSPEFVISEPSGKETPLSSLKGKVVAIEFLFLRSLHCMRVAQTLNELGHELGPRGFQPIAIVFGPTADPQRVNYLRSDLKLSFPIGYTTPDKVDLYLSREPNEVLNIPQVVIIDRAGVIRAQSGTKPGDSKLEDENSLRTLLDGLLKETTPRERPAKSAKDKAVL